MFTSKIRMLLASVAFATVALVLAPSFAELPEVTQTVAEHDALAADYREQAAKYRKEATEHRDTAATYAANHPDFKGDVTNLQAEKVSKRSLALARDYDQLATDASQMADLHAMQAKELRGG